MKKKNLIILLIFPFLISLFCIVTVNTTYNKIDVDISYIEWAYHDMEGFQINEAGYLLEAVGVNQRHYQVSGDSSLLWTVQNKDPNETEPCAEVQTIGGKYYLKALREGEVIITCSNQKRTVYRQMTGVIYKDAAILLYPSIGGSQTNIDSTIYYGQYDHTVGTPAAIDMTMLVVPTSAQQEMDVSCSENIQFDPDTGVINITGTGKASLTLSLPSGLAKPQTFSFEIVENGVNVYNYEDLMYCTNKSTTGGEIAVLRKSFESVYNAYLLGQDGEPLKSDGVLQLRANNVECFGNYDSKNKTFSFDGEVYRFTTSYNRSYIDAWNDFAKSDSKYSSVNDQVIAGLRVQKDFYGNGYTLNLHNLTYPYASVPMTLETGEVVKIPTLRADNLFRGPLTMYALGDPNKEPWLKLYGQDNIGMYVDGDDVTVNDVNLKNCEFGDRLANLATTGTVLEIAGDNVTVKNSLISNGRNVVRSFSSMELVIDNCMLSNSQNFLFLTGSNEFEEVDAAAIATFKALDGSTQKALLSEYFSEDGNGDKILNDFLTTIYKSSAEKEAVTQSLLSIQDALTTAKNMQNNFKGSTTINNCYFYQSGISSICFETLFNSPFLETGSPSTITKVLDAFGGDFPFMPTHVSGTSYPVMLTVSGDTRFYDYKKVSDIDISSLIEQTVVNRANEILGEGSVSLDKIFPLKTMAVQRARTQGAIVKDAETGVEYINIPVTYYGGGLNMSKLVMSGYENASSMGGETEINLLNTYVDIQSSGSQTNDMLNCAMHRVVTTVTGFEPFAFRFGTGKYLYGETPNATDLVANTKGD